MTDGSEFANRFTPDARERIARLRAMADNFPDMPDPEPLTSMQVRLARHTSIEALERAAAFAEALPEVATLAGGINVAELRDTIAFELAYGGVRDQAKATAWRIDQAILRRKLKAVKITRALYRLAKSYTTLDTGKDITIHVEGLKRALVRPRRRKGEGGE